MKIRSKSEFFRLWRAGLLGNRPLMWDTIEEAMASGCERIGFRELGKAGGGAWELWVRNEAVAAATRWTSEGRKFVMDGSVPNDHSTMQGEVCRTERGLESFLVVRDVVINDLAYHMCTLGSDWNYLGLPPMRMTMGAGWHRHRGYLKTKVILDHYMDPSSRDDLDVLLELYPDATIELTCFDIDTGVIPGRNTIFWEVRNY